MRSLGWTQRESSLLSDSVDPHNIRLQQTLMLRWVLLCDHCIFPYQSKTSEFDRPSMPMSHRHFLPVIHYSLQSQFTIQNIIFHYQPPLRALQLSTSSYIFSYSPTFWFHDTSMGHAHLVCIQILFFLPRERFGSHSFPSPFGGSLLQFLSSLFLTMALSTK
jgi:hypothetical protein